MSTKRSIATSAEAVESGVPITEGEIPPTVSPTVTHYQQLANSVMQALDQLSEVLPQLEATQFATTKFVRSHLSVSIEFLATVISAVEQLPELQAVNKIDVNVGRDTLQLLEAFRPLYDKVSALRKKLKFTMMFKRAALTTSTLQVYDIAKALARDANSAELSSHVENMKRDLGPRGRKKKAKAKAVAVAPPVTSA
jgi:hypothetical protein